MLNPRPTASEEPPQESAERLPSRNPAYIPPTMQLYYGLSTGFIRDSVHNPRVVRED